MKRWFILWVACVAICALTAARGAAQGRAIEGTWRGAISAQGMELRLVFHISRGGEGYISTMDSPDQGAFGLAVSTTTYDAPRLVLADSRMLFEFKGTLENDTTLVGSITQSGFTFPLRLVREVEVLQSADAEGSTLPPVPYREEEVRFPSRAEGVTLAGTLTLPEGKGPFPAVVLLSGSGLQNRDSELFGHQPFRVMADYLARRGIAVLRYDDRGFGQSKGDAVGATSLDFAKDAEGALLYLKERAGIARGSVGIVGHSEGAFVGAVVASERPDDVAFLVMMAGPGVRGDELLLRQQQDIGRGQGMGSEELARMEEANRGLFAILRKEQSEAAARAEVAAYLRGLYRGEGIAETEREARVTQQLESVMNPWMRYFLQCDPAQTLERVKCPVLALNGELDRQVAAQENLAAIRTALAKGGNRAVRVKRLPGLNHLFQECKTGMLSEYSERLPTPSPKLLKPLAKWVGKQVKRSR